MDTDHLTSHTWKEGKSKKLPASTKSHKQVVKTEGTCTQAWSWVLKVSIRNAVKRLKSLVQTANISSLVYIPLFTVC